MTTDPSAPSHDELHWLKGHGTENDFLLVPDADGAVGEPSVDLVRAMCDRRAGLGADGVIRMVRTSASDDPAAVAAREEAEWFMDYRNADGSRSEMCGNGIRVMGRYLLEREGVHPDRPLPIATRDGVKVLQVEAGGALITADMGRPRVIGETWVEVSGRRWPARHVDMGNPHAVAMVEDLEQAGHLLDPPAYDDQEYPAGVNVEFVVRRGEQHLAMRVHERGSGETRSCGTGACAVMVAAALADQAPRATPYRIDLPGGTLRIEWTEDDRILMSGPAVLVAEGKWFARR